ncbi:MAG: VPLPA-CTERM sorting domain-containing protein [Thiogranum sp.]
MFNRKTMLSAAVVAAMGGVSFSASAALTSSATLDFTLGSIETVACNYGTTPPCNKASYGITDMVGSYFVMDTNSNGVEPNEKTAIGSFNGIHIGTTQLAGGSHTGSINGSESPDIDNPWTFFGGTGMHQTTGPTSVASEDGNGNATLNLAWSVAWNGLTNIPMVATSPVAISCSTASCSDSSLYTLDATYHVAGAGFTSVAYTLHLEGHITSTSAVPVPAAAWLFGSGLMGLAGVARRRKSKS